MRRPNCEFGHDATEINAVGEIDTTFFIINFISQNLDATFRFNGNYFHDCTKIPLACLLIFVNQNRVFFSSRFHLYISVTLKITSTRVY